jgi:hypothetical protein
MYIIKGTFTTHLGTCVPTKLSNSGYCVQLKNRRSRGRLPLGCKESSTYISVVKEHLKRTQVRTETCCANKLSKILLPLLLVGVFAKTFSSYIQIQCNDVV